MGCMFAILCNLERFHIFFRRISVTVVALIVLLVFLIMSGLAYMGYYTEDDVKTGFAAYFGVLFCWLIACLYHQQDSLVHRFLELPILVYIGKISYGVYLYHLAVQVIVWQWLFPDGLFGSPIDYLFRVCIYFVLTLAVASVSFYTVESYFLKFKDQFRS